jgi:hypothetical protein
MIVLFLECPCIPRLAVRAERKLKKTDICVIGSGAVKNVSDKNKAKILLTHEFRMYGDKIVYLKEQPPELYNNCQGCYFCGKECEKYSCKQNNEKPWGRIWKVLYE